jgi:hypothetical protein
LVVIAALSVAILILRYAKAIIRTLMALGGLLLLIIVAAVVAIAMGWWQPSLMGLIKAVIR